MLPKPEALRQRHMDLGFIVEVTLFLLRAAHRKLSRRAPDQLHLQTIVVPNLTSFGAIKGWRRRIIGYRRHRAKHGSAGDRPHNSQQC